MAKYYVCANCDTPIEIVWYEYAQYGDPSMAIRCPGNDPDCSPREDRELLCEWQIKEAEIL
jgi:hypothetical protein